MSRVAGRQWGRVSRRQLEETGVSSALIAAWTSEGYLHRWHPRVYAVGHVAPSVEGALAAALLYAGPGAMLSHASAAWWWGLAAKQPATIHVSTPRRCKSLRGVRVHGRRTCERTWHTGLPLTPLPQTLLDYASVSPLHRLRRALAEADYRGMLDVAALEAALARGRAGSAKLRRALDDHQPRLALTRSPLEETFLELCERSGLPVPIVNATVEGLMVDALWREQRLIVELDGVRAHGSPAQMQRDRARDLQLRRAGYLVIRYSWRQLTEQRELVARDLRAALD